MAIAIIGASGQLGRDICAQVGSDATPLTHGEIELTDPTSLSRVLEAIRPSAVVNTAAYNLVDESESRPADAFAVNAFGVRNLSLVCRDLGIVLVHFSTDYVFGLEQERGEPYDELGAPGPLNVYGMSKLAGEYFVRSICPRQFVLRTCGLYGLHGSGGKGRNFVQTMLRLGRERSQVRVVNDQTCTPSFTADLAKATAQLLSTTAYGLYHWTNAGSCTWYQFACEIFRAAGIKVECIPITSEQYGARAPRPKFSVLSSGKFERLGFAAPRPWQEALGDYLEKGR